MIGEILCLIIDLFIVGINQTLLYVIVFGAQITKSKKKLIFSVGIMLVMHIYIMLNLGIRVSSAMTMFSMIIIPFFFFERIKKSYFFVYPFVTLATSIVGISISYFLAVFLNKKISDITQGNWYTVFCEGVLMVILMVFYIRSRISSKKFYQVNLGPKQYIVFSVVTISLFLMMAPMQSMAEGDFNKNNISVIGLSTSLGCIGLVLVTIWLGISDKKEIESREKSIIFEAYLETQKEYYEGLLQQEEKMRRFRHDMNAHLIALQAYASNGETKNIQEYLNRMVSESAINSVRKYTGNRIVDAIITQLKECAERKEISFEVQGYLQEESAEKSYDLCAIISNLLKNSIEACEKIDNPLERNIVLKVAMYDKTTYIVVKNSIKDKILIKEKYPQSTKNVSLYHGLGYGNLENIVNRYSGKIEFNTADDFFKVEIIL